jgi:hypothetical protein
VRVPSCDINCRGAPLASARPGRSVVRMNPDHESLCGGPEWAEYLQTEILPAATAGVDLGKDMLEIGPGPGAATAWLR